MIFVAGFRCICLFSAIMLVTNSSRPQCGRSGTPSSGSLPPGAIPLEWRPSLEERAALFTKAQAQGDWDTVAELLGPYPDPMGSRHYTPTYRSCLVSQMKAHPLAAADLEYDETGSNYTMICPPPKQQFWTMVSRTDGQTSASDKQNPAFVFAYRDEDNWYFTPQYLDDHAWAIEHTPAGEFERDLAKEVQIVDAKNSPIEVTELHAFRDRSNPGVVRLSFRFRNRTGKGIKIYDFQITSSTPDNGGTLVGSVGTGAPRDAIPPHGVSRVWEETDTQYSSYCQDHYPTRIEILGTTNVDGREWKAPKRRDPSPVSP